MIDPKILVPKSEVLWEIPKSFRSDMQVPARIYATSEMLEEIGRDRSLEQLVNVASLPGIQKAALVMPDVHEGYGFPIGAVAATAFPDGAISPGGIGYDINCGVRLLTTKLTFNQIQSYTAILAKEIYKAVPAGIGQSGYLRLNAQEFTEILQKGAQSVVEYGYGIKEDLEHLESRGTVDGANADKVSRQAKLRGKDQLGTMGGGNHFIEVERVDTIFDKEAASSLDLALDQVVILIHTGSRGLGHQVATDYIRLMLRVMADYGIRLPDRELACVPFSSPEGQDYFAAMAAAANYAFANRQFITSQLRQVWKKIFGPDAQLHILYDVTHNMAKIEEYPLAGTGQVMKVIVHRKGATRAFPKQPVLIPGSMGTASYVLLGTETALRESFGSTCHGAGRRMSRHQAKRQINPRALKNALLTEGIIIEAGSLAGIAEEAPAAYKNIDQVVEVVVAAGLARKVARLRPMVVIKG